MLRSPLRPLTKSLRLPCLSHSTTITPPSPSSSFRHSYSTPSNDYTSKPGPPRLPPAQQKEFDELVRRVQTPMKASEAAAENNEEELVMHPDFRAKPKPNFEGEVNPVTGEVGGPKREPLEHGDWSYGGKCTDF